MAEIRKTNIFKYLKTKYNNVASIVKMNGTQSAGSSDYIARADHVHPVDTSRAASNHSHGSLVNDGALNSDITSVNKVAVTDATNKLKTISKLPLNNVTHQDISGKANVNHSHGSASSSANGFLSKEDKSKLDGIATNANKTVVDSSLSSSSTNPVQNKIVTNALNGKANSSHSHSISNITNLQSSLDSKSETGHTHDDRYYTETEMNTKLNGKANSSHTHTASQISDLTVSTHILANGARLYKYGKIVLAVFNNYQYSGKTPYVWTDLFNIPSAYRPISTDNIYGHILGANGQIVAGSNKIELYPPQSSGGLFGHILWVTS
nr:MAG TPA: tail repeat-like protein [Caudoviricetes sp.]